MEAPLSSPSLNSKSQGQTNNPSFFMSSSSNPSSAASSSAQAHAPTSTAGQNQQQTQQYQPPQQTNQQSQHNPSDTTSPFLRDFNLVAEAAKRAQMAVLMRDLEAVGL